MDTSFAGEWDKVIQDQAITDPNTARSRTGYLITYAGVPLTWASKLQTKICLSSTESKMVALSTLTRENIFLRHLIMDARDNGGLDMNLADSKLHCTVHEDNTGTIAIAGKHRIHPRTEHINVKYWHYLDFMREHKDIISVNWISTDEQVADMLSMPLSPVKFLKFSRRVCGWKDSQPYSMTINERECDDTTNQQKK